MSLYLNHIAALSLNLTETLQPRLPNVFETAPDMRQNANEPDDAWHDASATPRQEFRAEPSAQAHKNTTQPISAGEALPAAQVALMPTHEQYEKAPIFAASDVQPDISNNFANAPQPKPSFETPDTNPWPLGQSNTPRLNEAETIKTNPPKLPEYFQPVTVIKEVVNERGAVQPDARYQPSVERIIEHTHTERILLERNNDGVAALGTKQPNFANDPTGQIEQATFASSKVDLGGNEPIAPRINQHSPVAELKPMGLVPAHSKPLIEPQLRAHTPPKVTPKFEAINDTPTAPTIQVTIGRIEIRATQNTDKIPAKPRAANTTLSLDDYLKQRNGGRS